jgi:hypothetical protein
MGRIIFGNNFLHPYETRKIFITQITFQTLKVIQSFLASKK